MWISKKKIEELEKRIERLEQKETVDTREFGKITFVGLAMKIPEFVRKEIKKELFQKTISFLELQEEEKKAEERREATWKKN